MTTLTHRQGGGPFFVCLKQDDGTDLDPAAADLQVRVSARGQCMSVEGTAQDDGYLLDFSELDLPPRLYPISFYVNGQHEADGFLIITGGC